MNPAWINPVSRRFALSRRFAVIAAMFLSVLLGILIYTITAIKNEQSNVILMDMAGRQGMLFQKHMNEVLLTSQGVTSDYTSTRELIHSTLNVLMEGGSVGLDTETGQRQIVPAVPSEEILIKLHEQQNYFNKIIGLADNFLLLSPDHPEFRPKLQTLRTRNSTLIGIADEAVKQLNAHSESNLAKLITWETIIAIFVGLLGVLVTRQGIRDGQRLENEIEERNRAAANLRATEQMYRQILDSIADMIFVKDQNFRILWANKAFRKYYNMTNEELRGILDAPFNEPEFTKDYNEADAHVFKTGNVLEIPEEPVTRHDGQVNLFHTIKAPLFDENREVVKLVGVARDITERKMSEEQAKRLFRQNELILASAGDGIYGLDLEGRTTFVNPAGANMLGYEPQELVGSFMHGTVHHSRSDGSPYPREECPMYAAFTDGTIHKVEDEVLWRKDGTSFPVEYSSTPIWQAGQLVGAVVTFRDITERKQAEEVLKKSRQDFQTLVDSLEGVVWECDFPSYRFTFVSQQAERLLGYPIDEWLREPNFFCNRLHDSDQTWVLEHCREATLRKENHEMEYRFLRKNGEEMWLRDMVTVVVEHDQPVKLRGVMFNITQIKQAEKVLQESEERYRVLYEDNPSMYFTVAQDGKILSVNRFGAQQLGYSVEELVGQPVIGVFHEDDKLLVQQHFAACLQDSTRTLSHWELRKQRKDGSVLYVREMARTIQGINGETVVLIVCEDITERKQTEERLRESEWKRNEVLRQNNELKSALLSSVSHELRTPLTAIKSSVSSIIGNVPSGMNEVQQELLKGVDREINYMSRLVDNLLDMSRIEAGTLIPHREWHPLEDLVEGALRRTEQLLETRNIEIHFPEEVPPVFVDAVEMQQVLINLLDNAVKYSASDSSIQIHVRVGDRQITVEVTNTGEAIQAQDLERIFERFYRRRLPHEQTVRGTGLGLAICKGIVEAHGGRIWAESAGRGVTITFTIPVTESMASFSLEGLQKSVT